MPIAREKLARLGKAGPRQRRPLHDRPQVPHPRNRLARQAAVARRGLAGPRARRVRHRGTPAPGARRWASRDTRSSSSRFEGGDADPDEVARWSSPLLRTHAGVRRGRGHLGRRAAARRMYAWAIEHSTGFEPAAPSAASTASTTQVRRRRAGRAARAVPQRGSSRSCSPWPRPTSRSRSRAPTRLPIWSATRHHTPKEGPPRRGLRPLAGDRARRELTLDIAPEPDPTEPRGADRTRRDLDPDRQAPEPRPRRTSFDLFVESFNVSVEGLDCIVLDPPVLLRLRPLLPGDRGHGRLSSVLRRLPPTTTGRSSARSDADRLGYEVISQVPRPAPTTRSSASGVLDIHTDFSRAARARARPDPLRASTSSATRADPRLP